MGIQMPDQSVIQIVSVSSCQIDKFSKGIWIPDYHGDLKSNHFKSVNMWNPDFGFQMVQFSYVRALAMCYETIQSGQVTIRRPCKTPERSVYLIHIL